MLMLTQELFGTESASLQRLKELEAITNHDVKVPPPPPPPTTSLSSLHPLHLLPTLSTSLPSYLIIYRRWSTS